MKELIHKLKDLDPSKTQELSLEEATELLEKFNQLKEMTTIIWELFKSFDTDKSDKRTMELFNNHASGLVINDMKKFQTSYDSFNPSFLNNKPKPPMDKNLFSNLENFREMADNYLEYHQYESQIMKNEQLVADRVLTQLTDSVQNSTCQMQ